MDYCNHLKDPLIKNKALINAHSFLCEKSPHYHAWHHHPHHKKVHYGTLAVTIITAAGLIVSSFLGPHRGKAAESFRANFDSSSLNADYSVGSGTASNDGSAATITAPGYGSSAGAVTVASGQTLKYPLANNLDPAKGEIEMKFQLPYDLSGDKSRGFYNLYSASYDAATGYIYSADMSNHRIVKTKIDGTGYTTFGVNGTGIGQFASPRDTFYDAATGYIYVADTGNNRIVKTKMDGTGWTTLGGPAAGSGVGQFSSLYGIYYDSASDFIYVADTTNRRIVKTKIDGTGWTTYGSLGSGVGQFSGPEGVFYDFATDYIYVADTGNNRIVKTKIDGTGWTTYGSVGSGTGQFSAPASVVYDSATDFLYVSDRTNGRIVKTKMDGTGWTAYSGFNQNRHLSYDSATGYLYVGDTGNHRIVKTKMDGTGWVIYGSNNGATGQFTSSIRSNYYDSATGYNYLADSGNNRIIKTKLDGTGWTILGGPNPGSGVGQFNYPRNIYYDALTDYIYVSDQNNHRIVKTKIDGTGWTTLGSTQGSNPGQFSNPRGVYCDSATGYMYVADTGNNRIIKTKIDGTGWATYGSMGSGVGQFNGPTGMFYDSVNDYIYITDYTNKRIIKTKIDGTGWTTYGSSGSGVGQFNLPTGVHYDSASDYLYIADSNNHRIVKTKMDGTGWTTLGGPSAGTGTNQFSNPNNISYDASSGYMYVADTSNSRLVKTQIDGTGWTTFNGDTTKNLLQTSGANPMWLFVNAQDGRFKFYPSYNLSSYFVQSDPQTFSAGSWHTIKVAYNNSSGQITMTLDGNSIASVTYPAWSPLSLGGNFYIGSDLLAANVNRALGAPIDEVKLTSIATDAVAPSNPTTLSVLDQSGGTEIANQTSGSGNWYKYDSPQFNFSGATDDDSGVGGYFVYFGTSNDPTLSDPQTHGVWQTSTSYTPTGLVDGQTYYLKIKTRDNAYNVSSAWDTFTYKYDASNPTTPSSATVSPAVYTRTNSYTFSWTASTDPSAPSSGSGIKSYEYKTGAGSGSYSTWQETDSSETSSRTISKNTIAYQEGQNIFYLRAKDNAGNVSEQFTVNFYYVSSPPTAPTSLTATPSTSSGSPASTNSFQFSWAAPSSNAGISGYHWSVNVLPTALNTTAVTATAVPTDHYATQTGENIFYVVAEDVAGNIDYNNYASASFYCTSSAPGVPVNIQVFDASNRDTLEYATTVKWSEPSQKGDNFAGYDIYRSENGGSSYTAAGVSTTPIFSETGLSSKEYKYYVLAKDSLGQTSAQSTILAITPTGKYTDPPNIVSGPTVTVTSGTVKVDWITDRESSSALSIYDQLGSNLVSEQGSARFTVTHSMQIKQLSSETAYKYVYSSTDVDGNTYTSDKLSVSTASPSTINNQDIKTSASKIIASWNTEIEGNSAIMVYDGSDDTKLVSSISSAEYTKDHDLTIDGLKSSTKYKYVLVSTDRDGNVAQSSKIECVTTSSPAISKVEVTDRTLNSAVLNITTSTIATIKVMYGTSTTYGLEVDESYAIGDIKTRSFKLTDLQDGTTYYYRVLGSDPEGNELRSDGSFATPAKPTISNVQLQPVKDAPTTSYDINWTTNVPTSSNIVMKSNGKPSLTGSKADLETDHVLRITGLADQSDYSIVVSGRDEYGNFIESTTDNVKTPIDTRPPKIFNVTTEIKSTGFSTSQKAQVVITWETDEPAMSQIEYAQGIEGKDYNFKTKEDSALSTSHVVIISELEPSKIYHLRAVSKDSAGNVGHSEDTTTITGKTQSSTLDIIVNSLQRSFSWITSIFK